MFTLKEQGWKKDKDEGPLKLKELHKKVQKEQLGYYEEEYQQVAKPKAKREERKQKKGGSNYFGMAEFAEIGGDDEEEEKIDTHLSSADERFKNINDQKLSDILIGNFKEAIDHEEYAFETFEVALKSGISKGDLIFGLFYQLLDNNADLVDKFDTYLLELVKKIDITKKDFTEGLSKYHNELINLE